MTAEPAPTPKGEATRRRILDAALAEFAEHGLAGARVDRIAAAAQANKAQLYAWFGSKDQLFDAVFFGSLHRIMDETPIDADDLADWAVRLYDDYLRRPDLIRLSTWQRLERRPTGHLVADQDRVDAEKLAAIARAQEQGRVRAGDPLDVMALVISMSMAWSPVSGVWAATADEPPTDHEARRDLLRRAVAAAVAPD
ncbi:TetR family transcriptional regulator [Nocardioides sp. CFH 31398]|uniref:TetR family transcriptional regulator n=1 Tax=Nocardioides sp. CFH 31398 TaxID=2919579 RepID=UPI001F070F3F|nr:TetR family transcriptional regulator [Nocardioides sp. CFH 31398]MCH1865377.1 TetR family transcriptional regulator [Nocardioides sp. CFH 31398]MCH1868761.1 TetR family transcriptional regulator [Nocardioides sp. CFH 31398]